MFPEVVPFEALERLGLDRRRYRPFPGLKEQVTLADFEPDLTVPDQLGLDRARPIAVLRPPATMSLYHRGIENPLFDDVVGHLVASDVQVVLLPRDARPGCRLCRARTGVLRYPHKPVDGPSLLYSADVVVSAGGSMNREAAVLGVPTWTTFAGHARRGRPDARRSGDRMKVIQRPEDLVVAKRTPSLPHFERSPTRWPPENPAPLSLRSGLMRRVPRGSGRGRPTRRRSRPRCSARGRRSGSAPADAAARRGAGSAARRWRRRWPRGASAAQCPVPPRSRGGTARCPRATTTGTPAMMLSKSLLGRFIVWLSVRGGWPTNGTSALAVHSRSSSGRTAGKHVMRSGCARAASSRIRLEPAVAHEHDGHVQARGARVLGGLDQLLEPSIDAEATLEQDDRPLGAMPVASRRRSDSWAGLVGPPRRRAVQQHGRLGHVPATRRRGSRPGRSTARKPAASLTQARSRRRTSSLTTHGIRAMRSASEW